MNVDHKTLTWPAFAGEKPRETPGPKAQGDTLLITYLNTPESFVLNVSLDTRLAQEPPESPVAESNGQVYDIPRIYSEVRGARLNVDFPDGSRAPWPTGLPPFGWN